MEETVGRSSLLGSLDDSKMPPKEVASIGHDP